ncbi:MAG: LOG family protein [Bacteroidetes bacterium]|nr:LOG family protein [Bacteroidota bacterium]
MNKTVTIFGSSKPLPGETEYLSAYKLGKILGEAGLNICSGGFQGIMDAVSKGAYDSGSKAIGITVNLYNAVPSKYLSEEIKCDTLFSRLEKLVDKGDAYIILPGGTGTLLELSLVWEYFNKGITQIKPCVCVGNMWNSISKVIDERMDFEKRETGLVKSFMNIEECSEYIIAALK